jgi:poly-beta-1,6-N-acetyl-D-glucosamine synthase
MTRYVIITPVRDEGSYIEATIKSVSNQTLRPVEWVIVDDGSTDRTGAIIDRYAADFPWIRAIHRSNRGFRKAGGGVVDAFYDGYSALRCDDWDFLVKLDGDLSLSRDYFQNCLEHFGKQPNLGIGGGEIYHNGSGRPKLEVCPRFHVRGATKIYRKACWEAIGGLIPAPGWDTIDEVKANMLGWRTRSFEDLRVIHHRHTGAADGFVHDCLKHGSVCYTCGYHPLFVVASCFFRVIRKPYVVGSLATIFGFLECYLRNLPRVKDPHLISYLRSQQLRRLCGLETIWK